VDSYHKLHLIAVCFYRHEDEAAFENALQSIKTALLDFLHLDWCPKVAMCDRAAAIDNALMAVFPGIKVEKCYFHMKKGPNDHKGMFLVPENFDKFEQNCRILASFSNFNEFKAALKLFQRKWQSVEPMATRWFMTEWGADGYNHWFSGYTQSGLPNTDNSLERFNQDLKRYVTSHL